MKLVNEDEQNERQNMKITKFALITGIALSMAFGAFPAQADGKGSARGGATDLLQPRSNDTCCEVVRTVVMECPKCQSDWQVKTDASARGVNKPTYLVEKHLCSKCGTELKTIGQGKQAKDVATHTCAGCKKS